MPRDPTELRTEGGRTFPATRWTLVFQAKAGGAHAPAALEELCRLYWLPIYAYLRRRGHAPADAEDATQQFFAELLADETLQSASAARGKLRTFLLAALQRSLADETRHRNRQKRGGGVPPVSLEWARAEALYFAEPVDTDDPEKLYFAAWGRTLMDRARDRLRASYGTRAELYTALEPYLDTDETSATYRETAAQLGISEVTVRVHVSRLRKRLAEMFRQEVRATVESDAECEAEMVWALQALRGG
jgi:RNA polymerase sigma-70 factor (ECF subfamily)